MPGRWSGRGAESLGLQGHVEKEVRAPGLAGKAGRSGDQLLPGPVGTGQHRAGWDVIRAPQGAVAIVAPVGGDAGLLEDVKARPATR